MSELKCISCARELTSDEVALHRKLVNRGSTEFMCLSCLSDYFKISEEELKKYIEYYKKLGCTLFMM